MIDSVVAIRKLVSKGSFVPILLDNARPLSSTISPPYTVATRPRPGGCVRLASSRLLLLKLTPLLIPLLVKELPLLLSTHALQLAIPLFLLRLITLLAPFELFLLLISFP